jgi:hypothetical protein
MGSIKELKYKIIKNFLTKDELSLIKEYCLLRHKCNTDSFDTLYNPNGDTGIFSDALVESLMKLKLPLMEKETGLKLFPTYSFWRMYTMFANLRKHTDRASCEISVTVKIGSDGTPWPIFIENNPIEIEDGDAVVYLGCELEHWREEFKGDWNAQVFMHYVDQNGPFKELKFDTKPMLGLKDNYRNESILRYFQKIMYEMYEIYKK